MHVRMHYYTHTIQLCMHIHILIWQPATISISHSTSDFLWVVMYSHWLLPASLPNWDRLLRVIPSSSRSQPTQDACLNVQASPPAASSITCSTVGVTIQITNNDVNEPSSVSICKWHHCLDWVCVLTVDVMQPYNTCGYPFNRLSVNTSHPSCPTYVWMCVYLQ